MKAYQFLSRFLGAALLVAVTAVPAFAQITTGTVTGTVKDEQGLPVPGATVVLVSESRNTRSAPAITGTSGDFVFPNVTADTYTVEVTMDGFRTTRRGGVAVSGGDRVGDRRPRDFSRRGQRDHHRHRRRAAHSVAERRAVVPHHHDGSRQPADRRGPQLRHAHGADARCHRHDDAPRRRRTEQHHDGRRVHDGHGQQRSVAADEPGGDRRGQGAHGRLPGRIRPFERIADHRRHQGRIQSISRIALRHHAQLRLELEQLGEPDQRHAEAGRPRTRTTATRSAARSGGPAATTSSSSSIRRNTARARPPTSCGSSACRRSLERQGDFSQTRDNNGNVFNLIKDPRSTSPCVAANTSGCFQDGGVLGRIPQDRLYQTGLNILKLWPEPNITQAPGTTYNLEFLSPHVQDAQLSAGCSSRLSVLLEAAGDGEIHRSEGIPRHHAGNDSRIQRHLQRVSVGARDRDDGRLRAEPDDVRRGDLRLLESPARPDCRRRPARTGSTPD